MASFTPSNLFIVSMGSSTLYIGQVDGSITSGTNYWDTGLDNQIISVMGSYNGAGTAVTNQALAISFTQTNGVVHTVVPTSESGTPYTVWVVAGGYGQKQSI